MGGRFGGVVDGFSLGPVWGGDGGGEETTSGHVHQVVFAGRHTLSNNPIFYVICYILSSGGFTAACERPS